MFRTTVSRRRCGSVLVLLAALAPAAVAPASTVLVDFDALNATGGPVSGSLLDAYLATYGITVSNVVGSGSPRVANAGTGVFLYPGFFSPPSAPNFLQQSASETPSGYRLTFSEPVASVSFTRAAMDPEMSITGMIAAEWTARAIGPSGTTLGQVGEPNYASYVPVPAATFTFAFPAPGIAALVIERPVQVVSPTPTTVYSPAIDNLVLGTPLPEPHGLVATAAAVALVAALVRRRKP
ncbi:MAG: hypothetical protein ACKOC8_02895 [Pirellulales bacterium]